MVTASLFDASNTLIGGPVTARTDGNGNYGLTLFAGTPPGSYTVTVEVSDGILSGTGVDMYECQAPAAPDPVAPPPPPAPQQFYGDAYIFAEDIVFLGNGTCSAGLLRNPEPNEPVGIHGTVHFSQSGPTMPVSVTIVATEFLPIGNSLVPNEIGRLPGVSLPLTGGVIGQCFSWTPQTFGTRIVQVAIEDASFAQFEGNDAATRAITVGTATCELDADSDRMEIVAGQAAGFTLTGTHGGTLTPTYNLNLLPIPVNRGLPAGLTFAFDPASPITGEFQTELTILTEPTTPPGRYPLVVVAAGDVCSALTPITLVVRSPNRPPVANAGPDQCVSENATVALDGTGSHDPDQNALTYTWSQIAGPAVTLSNSGAAQPTFTAPAVPVGGATLSFRLIVSDGTLFSEPDTVDVTVKNVNNPPVADADEDQRVNETAGVTLDGSRSYDLDNEPLTYQWAQTSGPGVSLSDANAAMATFTAPLVGAAGATLTFELTVNDGIDSDSDTIVVTVENVNHDPIANAGPDQTRNESATVSLDGSLSSDPDGDPLEFQWVQTGGPPVTLSDTTSPTPSFTAPQVIGQPEVQLVFVLVVGDGLGGVAQDDVTITIRDTNAPPACDLARPSTDFLWPPNPQLIPVKIVGVTDPEETRVTITITGVTQDEPTNGLGDGDTAPDAVPQGDTVLLRAERSGLGNGRVYRVYFTADDGVGGVCTGSVTVGCVPHDRGRGSTCTDDGQNYSSLGP